MSQAALLTSGVPGASSSKLPLVTRHSPNHQLPVQLLFEQQQPASEQQGSQVRIVSAFTCSWLFSNTLLAHSVTSVNAAPVCLLHQVEICIRSAVMQAFPELQWKIVRYQTYCGALYTLQLTCLLVWVCYQCSLHGRTDVHRSTHANVLIYGFCRCQQHLGVTIHVHRHHQQHTRYSWSRPCLFNLYCVLSSMRTM